MARRVKTLYPGLTLPDGNTYFQINMIVELTDAQFMMIDDAVFTAGRLEDLGAVPNAAEAPTVLPYAATITTNAALGSRFRVILTGPATLAMPTGLTDGQRIMWEIVQDNSGNRVLTLAAGFNLGPVTPTWSTAGNKVDYLGASYRQAATKMDVIAFGAGY